MTAPSGYSGTPHRTARASKARVLGPTLLIAVALGQLPGAARAEAIGRQLLGCWTMVHDDPRTTEMGETCFFEDGTVETMRTLTDEGPGSSGLYEVDGETIHVREAFDFPDGWLFRSQTATCSVRINGDRLALTSCSGVNEEPFSMSLVRSSQ